MSESRNTLKEEFKDEEYRHAYAEDFLNTSIATQIRVLREQRGLTQEDLAKQIGTKQAGISRLENVNHSAWKTDTLHKIARAFDVRLRVTFETFGPLLDEAEKFGRKELERPSFADDPIFHERVTASTDKIQTSAARGENPFISGSVHTATNISNYVSINMSTLVYQHRPTQQLKLPLLVLFRTDSNQIATEAIMDTTENPTGEVTSDRGTANQSRVV
jgi:transcriptional regulator with XRE-family HTH domain